MTVRTFDCRPSADPRNAGYPMSAILPVAVDRSRPKMWLGPYCRLDQGREGACVGFGWTIELMGSPIRVMPAGYRTRADVAVANRYASRLYHDAQKVDEWPGENYSGSSVNAGAKVARARGLIDGWRWAADVYEAIDAVITSGPVVCGVPWFEEMYETAAGGLVTVAGRLVGWHCITVRGYLPSWGGHGPVVVWRNSWGPDYGVNGDGYVRLDDFARLLDGDSGQRGEAALPIGRRAS